MRKYLDYYIYLFKYTIRLKYLSRSYIITHKFDLIFILLNCFLFGASFYNTLTSFNLPFPSSSSWLQVLTDRLLSYTTGVLIITFLTLLSKIRPVYLNWNKARVELQHAEICTTNSKDYVDLEPQKHFKNLSHKYTKSIAGRAIDFTEMITYSPVLNEYLIATNKLDIEISNKHQLIQNFILVHFSSLALFLNIKLRNSKNKTLHNELKLCLSEDIEIGYPVKCHKGSYFDTMLTNDVAGCYIRDNYSGKTLSDSIVKTPIKKLDNLEKRRIKGISETLLNNNMGGSTIAFTSDNYLVFWIQNGNAQHSEQLIAPTGSGSCDYKDLTENDLIKTVKKTMERELLEESTARVNFNDIIETKVIGYFRWLNRGGLPQFVGITKLKLRKDQLTFNNKEIRVANPNFEDEDDLYEKFGNNATMNDISGYLISTLKKPNLSVPLFYNLIALIEFIEKYPDLANDFFFKRN